MRLTKLACLGVLPLAALAQEIPVSVMYDLSGLIYPDMAARARIEGTVRLELKPTEAGSEVKLISGTSILRSQATGNLAKWRTDQPPLVDYVFAATDEPITEKVRVLKSNVFTRLFLRALHLPTYREELHCRDSRESHVFGPKVIQQTPLTLQIEITTAVRCLQTEVAYLS